ncbi:unnamed protein product [Prorocentrum cordatum]|uniref:Uncharacterized protein n=1 Tax=Prorocentrum cordatum TaxID=2364126 RepID=A0ABN9Q0M5_9DINO|nr:unnamed protein product [Polarella glacialis]
MPSPDGGDERGARPRRHTCACTPRPARHGDNDRIPWHRLPRTPEQRPRPALAGTSRTPGHPGEPRSHRTRQQGLQEGANPKAPTIPGPEIRALHFFHARRVRLGYFRMLATRACGSQAVRWQTLSKFLMRRARRRRRTGGRRRRRRGRRGGLARRIDKSSIDETLARTGTPGPRACLGNGRTDMRPKKRGKPATALCAAVGACRALVRGLFVHCAKRSRPCSGGPAPRPSDCSRTRPAQRPHRPHGWPLAGLPQTVLLAAQAAPPRPGADHEALAACGRGRQLSLGPEAPPEAPPEVRSRARRRVAQP